MHAQSALPPPLTGSVEIREQVGCVPSAFSSSLSGKTRRRYEQLYRCSSRPLCSPWSGYMAHKRKRPARRNITTTSSSTWEHSADRRVTFPTGSTASLTTTEPPWVGQILLLAIPTLRFASTRTALYPTHFSGGMGP